jgi:chromosomal replication initiator protein
MTTDAAQVREETITSIQEAVASMFGLTVEELRQGSNRRVIAVPRQIAMYLAKQMTDASLPEIGRHFGGRHHTTVMHSIAKVHELRSCEVELEHAVSTLLSTLARR